MSKLHEHRALADIVNALSSLANRLDEEGDTDMADKVDELAKRITRLEDVKDKTEEDYDELRKLRKDLRNINKHERDAMVKLVELEKTAAKLSLFEAQDLMKEKHQEALQKAIESLRAGDQKKKDYWMEQKIKWQKAREKVQSAMHSRDGEKLLDKETNKLIDELKEFKKEKIMEQIKELKSHPMDEKNRYDIEMLKRQIEDEPEKKVDTSKEMEKLFGPRETKKKLVEEITPGIIGTKPKVRYEGKPGRPELVDTKKAPPMPKGERTPEQIAIDKSRVQDPENREIILRGPSDPWQTKEVGRPSSLKRDHWFPADEVENDLTKEESAVVQLFKLAYHLDLLGQDDIADEIDEAMKVMAQRAGLKLEDMVALANEFDAIGDTKSADKIDELIVKAADMHKGK